MGTHKFRIDFKGPLSIAEVLDDHKIQNTINHRNTRSVAGNLADKRLQKSVEITPQGMNIYFVLIPEREQSPFSNATQ